MNLSITPIMKNPKVMGLVAAGLLTGAVIAGCGNKEKKEDPTEFDVKTIPNGTKKLFDAVKNEDVVELKSLQEEYESFNIDPSIDWKVLEQIQDSVNEKTKKDSANFVNNQNKTKADTIVMLNTFKDRDKTIETVQLLKNFYATKAAELRAKEQRKDS